MTCPVTVNNNVCVDAEVIITPRVRVGRISTKCVNGAKLGICAGESKESCSFNVSQEICVQIPLTFAANAIANPLGITCNEPGIGLCNGSASCTYTIGHYKNTEELILELLELAGGSIPLGESSATGLGYTVTSVAEAVAVLKFNIPTSALPSGGTYIPQYAVLYAQLLAAKLNVLNGASCTFATNKISDADNFLATSPPTTGKDGASEIQEDLALFNEGDAPDCPEHCND